QKDGWERPGTRAGARAGTRCWPLGVFGRLDVRHMNIHAVRQPPEHIFHLQYVERCIVKATQMRCKKAVPNITIKPEPRNSEVSWNKAMCIGQRAPFVCLHPSIQFCYSDTISPNNTLTRVEKTT
ncbi:unnamed protein product, partial [Ectocarpus fasciculatus]